MVAVLQVKHALCLLMRNKSETNPQQMA